MDPLVRPVVSPITSDVIETERRLGKGIYGIGCFHHKIGGQRHEQVDGYQAPLETWIKRSGGGALEPHSGSYQPLWIQSRGNFGKGVQAIAGRRNFQVKI